MNRVYAVSLPQLQSLHKKTICVSKNEKHFALKVVTSQFEFDQEVQCIAQINRYINEHGVLEDEFPHFYAFGSKKLNSDYILHNSYELVNFEYIKSQMRKVFSDTATLLPTPWWLYDPNPTTSINEGGVIVMLCGDLYNRVTSDNMNFMACGVNYWLGLYHKAHVVQRDIRLSNILRFSYPPVYTYFRNRYGNTYVVSNVDSFLQWQLIDFNLGYCLNESDHVLTKIHRKYCAMEECGIES
jgi:hypothetical protein